MAYPGLGMIGCEHLAGMYGVDEGIIDGKGTGVRHLFYKGFEEDLVHSAVTLVKSGGKILYGNRVESKARHPEHIAPLDSYTDQGFCFTDVFETEDFRKVDRAFGFEESSLGFSCTITNRTYREKEVEVYAYVMLRPQGQGRIRVEDNRALASGQTCTIGIRGEQCDRFHLVEEGPTGFIYRTTAHVLYGDASPLELNPGEGSLTGILVGRTLTLPPDGSHTFHWTLAVGGREEEALDHLEACPPAGAFSKAKAYWQSFLARGEQPVAGTPLALERINRIAIKSATNRGFVPADLTGHYYSDGMPSYYARDSMMVARAFLLSGHYREAKEILLYLMERPRKKSGEFYQRYNGKGQPSEGANNEVYQQLDSIGYFLRNARDYERFTGERLIDDAWIAELTGVLLASERKKGLVGPEGGVNEGVFGPAYITSSNMFIYGGIRAAIEMVSDAHLRDRLIDLNRSILAGIETTYLAGEGYQYGYVSYHDELVRKYDAPQYFGLLYGFEDTNKMRATHRYLLDHADFYHGGTGYSEQEYHHGPWLFNTGACAEYAYCTGDLKTYEKKRDWMVRHANRYGLMPEAISGDDERISYINPLVWACAEFVSVCHIHSQQEG